ncbi:protein takeout isoform X2 [Eupeodes corollae]|uniref:protein takeout isoform X2 n=1 Tax=Eupeodes corollae TaxID=290404 RepID=UPI002490FD36|nr:protein takeout isoform X2 [Eupeodes corollae]
MGNKVRFYSKFLLAGILASVMMFGSAVAAAGDERFLTDQHYIKQCRVTDKDFLNCSTQSIQQLFDKLGTGIPGLDSIKSFDPFYLNRIKINQGNSQAINLKVELSNIKILGFGRTNVIESIVYPKDFSWKTTFMLPVMKLIGDYSLFGRILLIPLNGKGKVLLDAENMTVIMSSKTHLYEKGGYTFYNVTNVRVDFRLDGLKSHFSNLFNGNKILEDSTNKFFNDNWKMLADALYTVITQTIEDILLDVLKKIFHYIPANFFVADIPTPAELYGGQKKS